MKKTQTITIVLVLLGAFVTVAMLLWLPASLFTIAALVFIIAAIPQSHTPNSTWKGDIANESGAKRSRVLLLLRARLGVVLSNFQDGHAQPIQGLGRHGCLEPSTVGSAGRCSRLLLVSAVTCGGDTGT